MPKVPIWPLVYLKVLTFVFKEYRVAYLLFCLFSDFTQSRIGYHCILFSFEPLHLLFQFLLYLSTRLFFVFLSPFWFSLHSLTLTVHFFFKLVWMLKPHFSIFLSYSLVTSLFMLNLLSSIICVIWVYHFFGSLITCFPFIV